MDKDETKDDETDHTSLAQRQTISHDDDQVEYDYITSSTSDDYPSFEPLTENIYLGDKKKRVNKEIRRMQCDCTYYPDEHEFIGCGEDCLNRLLMIECNNRCPCGEFCSNRKFQEGQKYHVEAFKTSKKGWGLRSVEDITANQFVLEYCGEVMGYEEFEKRVETYDKENRKHYYFMTLKADEIIDATYKGNVSRFINHSCSPNCETQKWTVNGYLRIGFFSTKDITAGTELTFDYKFQRYGKKAQACYCESTNCRGIIGGEKHTPLKSIISGRAVSQSATSSPRRNRRRRLVEQFDDKPLEFEIAQLLGNAKGIRNDEQALKLSQFMVRAETPSQRMLLLDTLWVTEDHNCLRSFVRYQGLSLLWSWMVDLGENSQRIQKKIVQVLKCLPVSNLNQVKDTKVLKVVRKWARKPSVACVPEEETSSSDVDSRGLSPLELPDDGSKRDGNITSTSVDTVAEDFKSNSETKDIETHVSDDSVNMSKTKSIDEGSTLEVDKDPAGEIGTSSAKQDVLMDSVFEACNLKTAVAKLTGSPKLRDSSEEDESPRWSEDDSASSDHELLTELAANLLNRWSSLKEVYRIPKKSTIVVEKRVPESTSGAVEGDTRFINYLITESEVFMGINNFHNAPGHYGEISPRQQPITARDFTGTVVTEPSSIRVVPKVPAIPLIDGDLFQKDEFISKLGERVLVEEKPPGHQDSTVNPPAEIPSLMSSATLICCEPGDDASKLPIHQRLQMVASSGTPQKQFAIWHAKGGRRARKHPYSTTAGAFQPVAETWAARHQVAGKPLFNQPAGAAQNQTMDPSTSGQPMLNLPNNPWPSVQCSSPYPGTYQYPQPDGCPQSSAPVGYSTPTPNQVATQQPALMQVSYFAAPAAQETAPTTQYQTPYPAQGNYSLVAAPANLTEQTSFGPQTGIQTNNQHGFQQTQQPVNQAHFPLPAFDPSQPPPNFAPSPSNVRPQQVPGVAPSNFQNTSPQFANAPPTYPASHAVPNATSYPLQSPQTQAVSQTTTSTAVESQQATPRLANTVSTTAMVSSTVDETMTETSVEVVSSKPTDWSVKSLSIPRDVSLPCDWKLAYDGEGRAYYYHVVTRQTQWDPPAADRSPPTPELGYHGDELDSSMEMMTTTFPMQITTEVVMEVVDAARRKKPKTPSTPPGSPPKSPVEKYTTAAADTTDVRKGLYSPSLLLQDRHLTPEQLKRRETFRMKLSAVVVNYLNPYHKIDCKVGRITTVDDFKFLARKLTHGVMVKELSRLKDESGLACNDSVKIKTKEYIRHYMQKFGPVYKSTS